MAENIPDLRKLQLMEFEILKEVKRICEKHGLVYYLDSGTLLGAIRHKGFIPWDDDIDVTMPITDYWTFIKIAQAELGNKYFVQNYLSDDNFYMNFTKIRINNTTYIGSDNVGSNSHQGIWLDIFPLIYMGSKAEYFIDKILLKMANILQIQDYLKYGESDFIKRFGPRGTILLKKFNQLPLPVKKKLHTGLLKLCQYSTGEKYITYVWNTIGKCISGDCFIDKKRYLTFEQDVFRVPYKAEKYLTEMYGNFMELPPVNKRYGHLNRILDFENDFKNSLVVKEYIKDK